MDNNVQSEIVRLVKEISIDEQAIRNAEYNLANSFSPMYKDKYAEQSRQLKDSMNRKIEVLKILKG